MFYRVTADFHFDDPDEADDFYRECEKSWQKTITINPDTPNEERSTAIKQRCYHDEDPTKTCDILDCL